ncbi:hypothetical protein R70006_08095 [Paraburkholderia domus]|nr:hypothetical protein R70006_08095 [Paraburkholderia domus]
MAYLSGDNPHFHRNPYGPSHSCGDLTAGARRLSRLLIVWISAKPKTDVTSAQLFPRHCFPGPLMSERTVTAW